MSNLFFCLNFKHLFYEDSLSGLLIIKILVYASALSAKNRLDTKMLRDGMVQWIARLTRDRWIPVRREFEPHQRPPLFP